MKEYLEKQADGSYKLVMRGIVGKDGDIEIPDGAIRARFYPADPDNLEFENQFAQWWHTDELEWIYYMDQASYNHSRIVWQRHTQPEELPFIDDGITDCREAIQEIYKPSDFGASSLNDQYAEIEQVRQSAIKVESGGDSDHMADAMSYGYMGISAPKKHRHYFKDVSKIAEIDVYAVLKLFDVTDPCLQHIVKKALCAGKRGHKDMMEDLQNIADTAIRAVELNS